MHTARRGHLPNAAAKWWRVPCIFQGAIERLHSSPRAARVHPDARRAGSLAARTPNAASFRGTGNHRRGGRQSWCSVRCGHRRRRREWRRSRRTWRSIPRSRPRRWWLALSKTTWNRPKASLLRAYLTVVPSGLAATQGADHEAVGRRFGKCCVAEAHVDGGFIDVVDRDGLAVATAGMTVRDRNV